MKQVLASVVAIAMMVGLIIGVVACGSAEDAAAGNTAANETAGLTAGNSEAGDSVDDTADGVAEAEAATYAEALVVEYDDEDLDDSWDASNATSIALSGGSATIEGEGASEQDGKITISAGGTYIVEGTLDDGQIVISAGDDETVRLVLNGADIACSTSAPIYATSAGRVIIILAEGTYNSVTDGQSYVIENSDTGEPDAAIFSKADLTINGAGSLTVEGNYNHGIVSKDDLKVVSGTITVTAVNDGIRGRDCIGIKDGTIAIEAGGDGLQSNNDEDDDKGFICISGGVLNIAAGTDGVQAETTLLIDGGDITLSTGGGSANSSSDPTGNWGDWGQNGKGAWPDDATDTAGVPGGTTGAATDGSTSASAKGLKAVCAVFIDGGTITIDSSDDSIHSNNSVQINGGTITLASGDDGIHSDATLEVNGGDMTITDSYEGIESAVITINDGTLHIVSADDGINVAGGVDASSISGRRGQGDFTVNENNQLYVNGGYVVVDATGDGIDCNGRVFMTDGIVLINGPTESMNGPVDYLGEFTISGGFLVAVGSSGMAQAPSDSSTQCALMVNLDAVQPAGTLVHVQSGDGTDVLTFAPTKEYQSVLVSSADIQEGTTYTMYVGGASSGVETDGLYTNGAYAPGSECATLTMSGTVVTSGVAGGMMGGGATVPGGGTSDGGMPSGTFPGDDTMPGGGTRPGGDAVPGGEAPSSDGNGTLL